MSEWNEKPLSDLAILYNDSWKVGDEKCPYIALEHIEESKLRLNGTGNSDIATSNKYRFNEKNFLFGKLRPYFRKVVRPQFSGICSTDIWVVGARDETDLIFLFYLFANQEFVDLAYSGSSGTRMPRADWKFMKDTVWLIPLDIEEQRAIASILSSLDNKIELLHRQNQTLEAMAEALFRQWFVEEAEEGWEEGKLGELVTITRGSSPRPIVKYIKNGIVPWIKIADATGSNSFYINSTKEFIIEEGVSKSVQVFPGDLILSNSATCGLPFFVELDGCIHDGGLLFRDFSVLSKFFVFFFLKQINRELDSIADGSVQNNLNTGILKEFKLKVPDEDTLKKFDESVKPIINKMKSNNNQIHTLEKLRDTLMTKLMNGEVRIEY